MERKEGGKERWSGEDGGRKELSERQTVDRGERAEVGSTHRERVITDRRAD